MIAVFANELRLLLRDRGAVLWLLLAPVVVVTVICAARYQSGTGPRFLVPVVDDDQGPVARTFIKLLAERVDVLETSRAAAESLVRDQAHAAAALVFPAGLSRRYLQGRPGKVMLLTDPAERVALGGIKVALLLMSRDAAALADPIAEPRIELVEQNLTGDLLSRKAPEQNLPGFTVMFTLLAVAYGTASSLQLEVETGPIVRLLVAPVGFGRVVLAKLAMRLVIGAVQILALLAWGRMLFDVSLGTSLPALVLVAATTAFAAAALGALTAGLARGNQQLLPLCLGLVLPLSAVSGLWWPLHAEPGWMRVLAIFAFPSWAMRALTDLVLRDRGLVAILPEAGVIVLQGAVLLVTGVWLFRARVARR